VATTTLIEVVSFNENEAAAVEWLLDDLASGAPSPWARAGSDAIERPFGTGQTWRLKHVPLRAQGNVLAAAQLAAQFAQGVRPDHVVFFGCAGAVDPVEAESAFLVQSVNYLSLGTVDEEDGAELVTLKNKWLCHLQPPGDVQPLSPVTFPMAQGGQAPVDLCALTGIPPVHVAATDKVVRIGPASAPQPSFAGMPHDRYDKKEWSYGQALGLVQGATPEVIVEMESFGIGCIAQALKFQDEVAVLRITTDTLTDHSSSDADQQRLLLEGAKLLGLVVLALFDPTGVP
jgi:hypothetical protein